jgi:hypothetical protein
MKDYNVNVLEKGDGVEIMVSSDQHNKKVAFRGTYLDKQGKHNVNVRYEDKESILDGKIVVVGRSSIRKLEIEELI